MPQPQSCCDIYLIQSSVSGFTSVERRGKVEATYINLLELKILLAKDTNRNILTTGGVVRSTRAPGPSCEVLGYRKGTTTVQLC